MDGEGLSTATVRRMRHRSRVLHKRVGLSEIRFDSIETPVGLVYVALSERGVCDVTFGETDENRYRDRLWAARVRRDSKAASPVLRELDAYFAGRLTRFSVPVDLRRVTPFTRKVLEAAKRVAFGQLTSYGDIAKQIGLPNASRAVGGALGRNPVPVIVPCHRVIARGCQLGGFTGGLDTKRVLLRLEGCSVDACSGRVVVAPMETVDN